MTASALELPPRPSPLWHAAQYTGLALTMALIAGLFAAPELALNILWNAAIPILPAVFLASPTIWRNVCPLATLTLLPGDGLRRFRMSERLTRTATLVGIVLLVTMVPARRLLFNSDGAALAGTIAAVALLSLSAGVFFVRKSGFCNAICPVLPVERLYGQSPLARVTNVRCNPCIGCTERGCIDLSPADSVRTAIGPRWYSRAWMATPYGLFAASFPGFIIGYFTTANSGIEGAGALAVHMLVAMTASAAITVTLVLLLRMAAALALVLLAAAAAGLYYWYAAAAVATAWSLGGAAAWGIRLAAAVLIAAWLRVAARGAKSPA